MTLTIALGALILVQIVLRHLEGLQHRAERRVERAQWAVERAELLNRIQHPHVFVTPKEPTEDRVYANIVEEPAVDLNDDLDHWRARGYEVDG